ncbi:hypothetical protein E2C01_045659 [Portunus trituberculatus]|uniref:Uncharacterized protein n=1 Tax=Portunus trituberculatus TaxID=210409 RepID=A0A5B7G317_PORTR|nr:hypothetical protein [Portunus trituberculatus]
MIPHAWRLDKTEQYKKTRIKWNMNEKERKRLTNLQERQQLYAANNVQGKWEIFVNICNEGGNRYVPKIRSIEGERKDEWCNTRRKLAKVKKETAWNK